MRKELTEEEKQSQGLLKTTLVNIMESGREGEVMIECFRNLSDDGKKKINAFLLTFMELLTRKTTPQTPEWDFEFHALMVSTFEQFEKNSDEMFNAWMIVILGAARAGVEAPSFDIGTDMVN